MALSCFSATAFAADPVTNSKSETINTDHTFELYQIFTGQISNSNFSNPQWGQDGVGYSTHNGTYSYVDGTETKATNNAQTALSYIETKTQATNGVAVSDQDKLAVITPAVYGLNDATYQPYKTTSVADQPAYNSETSLYTYTDIPAGYYLVKDTNPSTGSYTLYIADDTALMANSTDKYQLTFKLKDGITPTATKTIEKVNNNSVGGSVASASYGDTITYSIAGTVASNISDYKEYYYVFKDVMSSSLQFASTNNVSVAVVNGTKSYDVTKYFYKDSSVDSSTSKTTLIVGIQDLLQLKNVAVAYTDSSTDAAAASGTEKCVIDKDSKIVVTYTAKLLNTLAVGDGANDGAPNDATLDYYNNPNASGNGNGTNEPSDSPTKPTPKVDSANVSTTEKSTAIVYTTGLKIYKYNQSSEALAGAEFTLTPDNGSSVKLTLIKTTKKTYEPATTIEPGNDYKFYKFLGEDKYTTVAPTADTASDYELLVWCRNTGTVTEDAPEYIQVSASNLENLTEGYEQTDKYVTYKETITTSDEFTAATGEQSSVKGTTDANGYIVFEGLGAGKYTLSETLTPAGYNTAEDVTFMISFDGTKAAGSKFSSDDSHVTYQAASGLFETSIENRAGAVLPNTGGIGTTIFYLVGTVLVLGAGIALVVRRRMRKEASEI
jgi:fimbrial isopeptide formation D2 family protein/LPXTG-motif cell wall-anchored protein